jgi:pimeloyl-ACP methyl ester carboxylesterase
MSIDRDTIIANLFGITQVAAHDFATPAISSYSDNLRGTETLEFNPDEAKQKWADAEVIKPWEEPALEIAYDTQSGSQLWAEVVARSISSVLPLRVTAVPYPTREALAAKIGERLAWSVEPSFRQTAAGWTLAFSPNELADALPGLAGSFWSDWSATDCPVLLVRGTDSRAVDGAVLERMAASRPHTTLVSLPAGHVVHHDEPKDFAAAVKAFLAGVRG